MLQLCCKYITKVKPFFFKYNDLNYITLTQSGRLVLFCSDQQTNIVEKGFSIGFWIAAHAYLMHSGTTWFILKYICIHNIKRMMSKIRIS